MSDPHPPAISSQSHSISEVASSLALHIPKLLHRLHDLQEEEAKLDAQARQLMEQISKTSDESPTPSHPIVSTPVSKVHIRTKQSTAVRGPGTPPHVDPGNFETPVKAFLWMESFAMAMSVKSKRKGRIFLAGDSTEFGEKR